MRLGQLVRAHKTLAARLAQAPLPPGSGAVARALADELARPAPDPAILDPLRLEAETLLGVSLEPAAGEDSISAARRALEALGQRGAVEHLPAGEAGRAMVALATGGSPLPVFSRARRSALNRLGDNLSPLRLRQALDREWLTLVAAVRPALARLESFQLAPPGRGGALQAWSNRQGWSVEPPPPSGMAPTTQLRAVYAPRGVLAAAQHADDLLAVVTLDAWTETVPDARHTTTAALAFNAPGARAPQAILLAAPPEEDRPLDTEAIAGLIAETRLLAHGRMATLQDLSADWAGALPLAAWLPSADPGGVPLDVRKE
jgi:hypothetical protein